MSKSIKLLEAVCVKRAFKDLEFRQKLNPLYLESTGARILAEDLVNIDYLRLVNDEELISDYFAKKYRSRSWWKGWDATLKEVDGAHGSKAYEDLEDLYLRASAMQEIAHLKRSLDTSVANYQASLSSCAAKLIWGGSNHSLSIYDAYVASLKVRPYHVASGFKQLDKCLGGGFSSGRLHIIGARTGIGKSSFCISLAAKASKAGVNVVYVSMEMSYGDIVKRFMDELGICLKDMSIVLETLKSISNLSIVCQSQLNLMDIEKLMQKTSKPSLFIIDYLGLVTLPESTEMLYRQIGRISKFLSSCAKKYDLPIVAASQLKRPGSLINKKEHVEPELSDLKESGELEQDADTVLLLHRPDMVSGEAKFILAKNRFGPCVRFPVQFNRGSFSQHEKLT